MAERINPVVGRSVHVQDNEAAFQLSLQRLAYKSPDQKAQSKATGTVTRKSRFFFRLKEEEPDLKKLMAPKPVVHVDDEVVKRVASYTKEVAPELKLNLEAVREFFLTEVAPLTLAASGGAIQATDVIQRMVDSEVDPAMRGRFEQMVNRAAVLRMGLFVTKYFKLPQEHLANVMGIKADSETQNLRNLLEKLLNGQQQIEQRLSRGQLDAGPVPGPSRGTPLKHRR